MVTAHGYLAYGGSVIGVVGEAQRQDALEKLTGGRTREAAYLEVTAVLVPEPGNPHDSNAVRVEIEGLLVGYLSRADALAFGSLEEPPKSCPATIVGGWKRDDDEGMFGVYLDLVLPD